MTATVAAELSPTLQNSVEGFVKFLATGGHTVADGLFTEDVFGDLTFPHWWVQFAGREDVVDSRRRLHGQSGTVHVERVLPTSTGYAITVEERWEDGGQQWYCREAMLCDLDDSGSIRELTVYCTGDWDEARQAQHRQAVALLRA